MQLLAQTLKAAPNAGRQHLFFGHPLGDTTDKTTVEPGGAFSPGLWTCGISAWVETAGEIYSPDVLPPDQIAWQFDSPDGAPPVARSTWPAGERLTVVNRMAHLAGREVRAVDIGQLTLTATGDTTAKLHIVVRAVGPAGGPLESLDWNADQRTLTVNGVLAEEGEVPLTLVFDQPPDEVNLPTDQPAEGRMAVFTWNLTLGAGENRSISFRAFHAGLTSTPAGEVPPSEQAFVMAQERWNDAQCAGVTAPDGRISRQWQQCLFHIASAMECGLPRISAVDYPALWIRGGSSILRALDVAGQHELARIGLEALAPLNFSGPFGVEADLPSLGIWALVQHAQFTRDETWLRRIMPYIHRRVHLLEAMLHARKPIRIAGENVVPAFLHDRRKNLLCQRSVHGLIVGRAGPAKPGLYHNAWAACGLTLAAAMADQVGRSNLAQRWQQHAHKLDLAITEHLLPGFACTDELDTTVAPYPTGILLANRLSLRRRFEAWYKTNRLDEAGRPVHDRLYPYVEMAQVQNALQLGLKEMAWTSLDELLGRPADAEGRSFIQPLAEGAAGGPETLPFGRPAQARGWLNPTQATGANMPNAWAAAEMIQLIRGIFVTEADQRLILGLGVPEAWLKPGCVFGVTDMPTGLGPVSYQVTVGADGAVKLDYRGPHKWQAAFPIQVVSIRR